MKASFLKNENGFAALVVAGGMLLLALGYIMSTQKTVTEGFGLQGALRGQFDESYLAQRQLIGFLMNSDNCLVLLQDYKSSLVSSSAFEALGSVRESAAQTLLTNLKKETRFAITGAQLNGLHTLTLAYKMNSQTVNTKIGVAVDGSSKIIHCNSDVRDYSPPNNL